MICKACGTDNIARGRFCNGCGAALVMACPRCGFSNPPAARFCGDCATPIGATGAPSPSEAERRQLTVLFCDLVGSTELSERLDPEDLREVVQNYHAAASQVIRELDGYVAQYLGDGILSYFGYPVAHEDDARRAVLAGLGLIKTVPGLGLRLPGARAVELHVRIGIHTGSVVLGSIGGHQRQERLALGETPNLAARLQSLAEPDTVVISDATYRLTRGFFECQHLGARVVKGISHPLVTYRVMGASLFSSRVEIGAQKGLTPLVNRTEELAALEGHWHVARGGGSRVVLLTGEPGIGKSRLLLALKERLAGEPHVQLKGRCSAYHQGRPLHPIIDLFERRLGGTAAQSPDRQFERLRAELGRGPRAAEALPLLAALLSVPGQGRYTLPDLSPQKLRQATFEAIRSFLLDRAGEGPALFLMEDLHWADPSTLELLEFLGREPVPGLLVLLTARPEFSASWTRPESVIELMLGRLSGEQSASLLAEVLVSHVLSLDVRQQVLEKADGVPLFVEEITRAVLESGVGETDVDRHVAGGPAGIDRVPATLHDSLMARLDRLGPGRTVAKLAATFGREFAYEMLVATALIEQGELLDGLECLERAQLIYREGQPPEARYTFKHALIQEAAYQSLLRSTRQQYHHRIVETLGEHFPGLAEAQPELMAQHCAGAGLAERAVIEWERAGQRALARSACAEAIGHFSQSLEQLAALSHTRERDQLEIRLRVGLGRALISAEGVTAPEVEQVYARSAEMAEGLGALPISVLYGQWIVPLVRGDREETLRMAAILRRRGETSGDMESQVLVHANLGFFAYLRGDYTAGKKHCERARHAVDGQDAAQVLLAMLRSHGIDSLLNSYFYEALCDLKMGAIRRARSLLDSALAMIERTQHPYLIAVAQLSYAGIASEMAEATETRALAERVIAAATDNDFPFLMAPGLCSHGWALAQLGAAKAGIAEIRQGLALIESFGAMLMYPIYLMRLAEAYLCDGDVAEGMAVVRDALARSQTSLACDHVPPLQRLAGEYLLLQGDEAAAERAFRESLAMASDWHAHLDALRAATCLGRLLGRRGCKDEGRVLVAEAAGKLTEGLEIPPVAAAKALLRELS